MAFVASPHVRQSSPIVPPHRPYCAPMPTTTPLHPKLPIGSTTTSATQVESVHGSSQRSPTDRAAGASSSPPSPLSSPPQPPSHKQQPSLTSSSAHVRQAASAAATSAAATSTAKPAAQESILSTPVHPDANEVFRTLLSMRIADPGDSTFNASTANSTRPPKTITAPGTRFVSSEDHAVRPVPHPSPTLSRAGSPPNLPHLNAFLTHPVAIHHPPFPSPSDTVDLTTEGLHHPQTHFALDPSMSDPPSTSQASLSFVSPSSGFLYPHRTSCPTAAAAAAATAVAAAAAAAAAADAPRYAVPAYEQLSRGTPSPPPTSSIDLSTQQQHQQRQQQQQKQQEQRQHQLHVSRQYTMSGHFNNTRSNHSHYNHHHHHSNHHTPRIKNDLYKTEICRSFAETGGYCKYGSKCQFAHGEAELRPVRRHPRYKTKLCRNFSTTGTCPYDTRCRFIHAPANAVLNNRYLGSAALSPPVSALHACADLPAQPFLPHVNSKPNVSSGEIGFHPTNISATIPAAAAPSPDAGDVSQLGRPKSPLSFDPALSVYNPTASAFRRNAEPSQQEQQQEQQEHLSQQHANLSPAFSDIYAFSRTGSSSQLDNASTLLGGNAHQLLSLSNADPAQHVISDPIAASVMAALHEADEVDNVQHPSLRKAHVAHGDAMGLTSQGLHDMDRSARARSGNGGVELEPGDPAHIISQSHVKQQVMRSRLPVFRNMVARSEDS